MQLRCKLKSYWIRVSSKPNHWCPYNETHGDTEAQMHTEGRRHVKAEAEIGVTLL